MNIIEIFVWSSPLCLKVSETYTVDLAIELQRDVFWRPFSLLCFAFIGTAPYVQAAIMNLPHPEPKSTTVLLDDAC